MIIFLIFLGTYASYVWAGAAFFKQEKKNQKIAITKVLGLIFITSNLYFVFEQGSVATNAQFFAALALLFLSNAFFWWAAKVNREKPLNFAFHSSKSKHLITSGPYSLVRHPFYLSYLLGWLAAVVFAPSIATLLSVMLMGCIYVFAMKGEEAQFLASELSEAYRAYMKQTKRILPFVY